MTRDACLEATRSTFTSAWKDIGDVDSNSLATCSQAFDHDQLSNERDEPRREEAPALPGFKDQFF